MLPMHLQGKRLVNDDGSESFNDQYHENVMLQVGDRYRINE
jgi:hypothetical protein